MKKANLLGVSALAICFVLLAAVGLLPKIDKRVSASQSNPDCKNDEATRDRIKAALASQRVSDLTVEVKDGKVRVEGKVACSADIEIVKIGLRNLQDRCISEDGVNTDGIEILCSSDKAILRNVNYLLSNLSCPLSNGVTVSVKNRVATISGTVPDERYKSYVAQLVESADCVEAGVKNNLVISARRRFSGDCSRLSAPALQKVLREEVRSRMPCGVAERAGIKVADGVVTLTGDSSSGHRPKILDIIRSVCPGFFTEANLLDKLTLVDPSCPIGAKSYTSIDGEAYCCTGCRVCPAY